MDPTIGGWLLTVGLGLLGWIAKVHYDELKGLRERCAGLERAYSELHHHYAKRDDMKDSLDAIFRKLDHIDEKLDRKADK